MWMPKCIWVCYIKNDVSDSQNPDIVEFIDCVLFSTFPSSPDLITCFLPHYNCLLIDSSAYNNHIITRLAEASYLHLPDKFLFPL